MIASPEMKKYFEELKKQTLKEHQVATEARKKSYDPEDFVEVKLAENLAERVIGLISSVAPQLTESGAIKRILELEKEIAPQDWRVALKIALEIAQEKFCEFKDQKEAMETGIRTGFAYVTLGVVSAPLEGFTGIELKERLDNKGKYMCLNYAGPVRAAGGTGAAVSVLIADYVRKHMGLAEYDPTDKEIRRCHSELEDYHEYVANLQYFPSKTECEYMMKKIPVEISGDASEKREISSALLKDLPRIPTNKLRSGYCLIHSSCIPLKAPKLWKNLSKWGNELGMEQWNFLEEFLKIQSKSKAKGAKKKSDDSIKLSPDYTYIKDLVGGRPVLGHPMRSGAFRLRYGRSRTSGFSAQSIHPATMQVLNKFVATGTQLKVERPGKAAAYTVCDTIDGPIVKLKSGEVKKINEETEAKHHKEEIEEIIYAGDVLINYGDFFDRAHKLIPAGYCQEYWVQELEEAATKFYWTLDPEKLTELINIKKEKIETIIKKPLKTKLSFAAARELSEKLEIPLHPDYTYYWKEITASQFKELYEWMQTSKHEDENIVLKNKETKRVLELIGTPHKLINKEYVVIEKEDAKAMKYLLQRPTTSEQNAASRTQNLEHSSLTADHRPLTADHSSLSTEGALTGLEMINRISKIKIRDKSGIFIGSRMGRPEKAKMRSLTGTPHVLFPVGNEGGRMRSFQSALEKGKIRAQIKLYNCEKCNKKVPFRVCHTCNSKTKEIEEQEKEPSLININDIINDLKKRLKTSIIPDLIKGVRGTSNKEHVAEHLMKGILRAKHEITVNKDGTIRYDASELPITHFKPKETGTSIEKLKKLGYTKDINKNPLENEEQILELKIQDILLPASPTNPEEKADDVMFRTTKFIDEMLEKLYGLKPYYNYKSKEDLAGTLAIGLAPHTSAGIVCRIIGISKTQGFFAHPYIHAAMRRDADGDESCITLALDAFLNFSQKYLPSSRGSVMDAPLVLTSTILPGEVDDMIFNMDVAYKYPLALYRAAEQFKTPYDVKVALISHKIGTPDQYENIGFTHDTTDLNKGVLCSAYKLLPSMGEKVEVQMDIARKLRAVDESDVAKLIINKHFIRDTKGNLRKFSLQQFRCVACNEKYRRPPLAGKCAACGGKIIFTISEGSIIKYIDYCMDLVNEYTLDTYTRQAVELTKRRIEGVFGKEKEIQTGLGSFVN